MFIAIEGPNGVGKTSVLEELRARLEGRGKPVVALRQPSDTPFGHFIREHHNEIRGIRLATYVVADRYLQIDNAIGPAIDNGSIVLLDRYVASTLVLQRMDGVDPEFLLWLNSEALVPDLTIVLDASAPSLRARLDARGRISRFEATAHDSECEIQYFDDAAIRLTQAGYTILRIATDDLSVAQVADIIEAKLETVDRTARQ
jgi:dTMP kinase